MASRPAIRIKVQNGNDFQTWTRMASDSARVGSLSQFGPSSPVSRKIAVLMIPHSGLSMKRNDRMVGIDGTAQGRMNKSESQRIQARGCAKKPDSISARIILIFTPTSRNTTVFTAERAKIGSSHSLT